MLERITLENFKAFKKAEIEIKPITILIGPNNGGKSSILQAIGLMKQTINSNNNDILRFIGDVDYGDFKAICHQNNDKQFIKFRYDFDNNKFFESKFEMINGELVVTEYSCNNGDFQLLITDIKKSKDDYKFKLHISDFDSESIDKNLKEGKLFRENFLYGVSFPITNKNELSLLLSKSLDDYVSNYISKVIKQKGSIPNKSELYKHFDNVVEKLNKVFQIQNISSKFNRDINEEFKNIRYIGPLREPAKRNYIVGKFNSVGYKGANAVPILDGNNKLFNSTEKNLIDLEVVNNLLIDKQNIDKKIIALRMNTSITDKNINFADMGCGTSQLLPIIVEMLLIEDNSLVMVEQPETHLHPKIQQEYTDIVSKIFSSRNNDNKKIIIETHSNYILERIRTLIMDTNDPNHIDADDVKIYYIEQNPSKKESDIQEITISDDGKYSNIPDNYPKNFAIRESDRQLKLTLQALEKRQISEKKMRKK